MARLKENEKALLVADHHTGYYTQRELSKKYDVSTATVNKLTKGLEPKHTDKVNAIVTATRELNKESEQEVNAVQLIVNKQLTREELIYGNAEKLAGKINTMADQIDTPSDLKTLSEANDKLAVTLKVAERHANSQVTVNTQTNIQNNTLELSEEEAKEKALSLGVPLSALM